MRHSLRPAMVAAAVGALLLTACGSEDSGGAVTSLAATADIQSAGDFNDADVTFAQGLIPHHQQAVEMAGYALAPEAGASPDPGRPGVPPP